MMGTTNHNSRKKSTTNTSLRTFTNVCDIQVNKVNKHSNQLAIYNFRLLQFLNSSNFVFYMYIHHFCKEIMHKTKPNIYDKIIKEEKK